MKIVIAIDSFKNCASSFELALHIEKGIRKVYKHSKIIICPIADGGEGTVEALSSIKNSKLITTTCSNPIGKSIQAQYIILQNNIAIIEMASASGLELIAQEDRNPSTTTTFGTGEIIKDAIKKGVRDFIIGIGGSATNDAGLGMLRALGFRFLDKYKKEVILAKNLGKIIEIDQANILKELKDCKFKIACDVNNPLYGLNGATHIYASQKGADDKMILELDEQLELFAKVVQENYGKKLDEYPGAGAAGGLGFGFLAFLNSELKSGIKIILEQLDIQNKIKGADFVITGEGKIDKQSSMGKVISGIGKVCKKENVTCIALTGNSSETELNIHEIGITAVFPILNAPINQKDAMNRENTLNLIRKKTEQIFRLIRSTSKD
ncbi:MAG: glycerate kinase [Epsilonproteobacteria bacterium]|nr:glycerate kinase [Campylobacterota bacterium]